MSAKTVAASIVSKGMSLLPVSLLQKVELAAQLGQGKGWGTETVEQEVRAGLELLGDRSGSPVVADVGANVGRWTEALLALVPGATVHAFEPSSTAFAQLSTRVNASPRVQLHRCAVGREPGTATLWADQAGSVLASLERRRLDHHALSFDHSEEVEVVTLDDVFADITPPSWLKIDVEGRELDVLAGATKVLESVQVVQFEFGGCNIDTRTYIRDFWFFFTERGFRLHRIGPRGVRPLARYHEIDEFFVTTNLLASR
jgi:FkbM family methyltransferase